MKDRESLLAEDVNVAAFYVSRLQVRKRGIGIFLAKVTNTENSFFTT